MKTPTTLIIMDGFGLTDSVVGNAVKYAKTPVLDRLFAEYPHTTLSASGLDVGLPAGQMGNSEVGHTNIGAGRVVFQILPKITHEIETGKFFENEVYIKAMDDAVNNGKALHIMGLLSNGGVHSHIGHIFGILDMEPEVVDTPDAIDLPEIKGRGGEAGQFPGECFLKGQTAGIDGEGEYIAGIVGTLGTVHHGTNHDSAQTAVSGHLRIAAVQFGDHFQLHFDHIAGLNQVRRNVDLLAVDGEVTVVDQLTSLAAGVGQTQTEHNVVQTAFQDCQQVFACLAGTADGHLEVAAELALQNAIESLGLLLFTELLAILGALAAALAVLAGSECTIVHCALVGVAAVALQEELLALSAALAANCFSISCHIRLPPSITRDDAWEDGSHCEEWG